ncbi:2'-5' RNA ligase family protein [Mycolicibacterium grossiae]|uniref:2'-5' RNA ligase n=1 Tax=Mycolicibacterium grossiae TaxID=1552759 RepID=A0A1E8PYS1_9MYCO|nr:2'-5' RNA ligase family protein [Mycolicibacterium grossiae]OFJ51472.1 hypothetical protein BEL07_22550 [Mycolicibacterium grossiae]QEM46542.1 2'-5' RNA ligase family protein [Mycolicibacterium grossiae]
MAHSIELTFDAATDAAVRREWDALADAGLPSQARHRSPTNRPHVTMTVADHIAPNVDDALRAAALALPLDCRLGAPLIFGRHALTLVRLVVPSEGLLALHRRLADLAGPHQRSGPFPHARPDEWTPHVTLCRRLAPVDLPAALAVLGSDDVPGRFAGLRRWDGDARIDTVIAG